MASRRWPSTRQHSTRRRPSSRARTPHTTAAKGDDNDKIEATRKDSIAARIEYNFFVSGGRGGPNTEPNPKLGFLQGQGVTLLQTALASREAFRYMGWWEDGAPPVVAEKEALVEEAEKSGARGAAGACAGDRGTGESAGARRACGMPSERWNLRARQLVRAQTVPQNCFVTYQYVPFTSQQAMELNADAGIFGIRPYVPSYMPTPTDVAPSGLHAAKRVKTVDRYDRFGDVDPLERYKKSAALRRIVGAWRIGQSARHQSGGDALL